MAGTDGGFWKSSRKGGIPRHMLCGDSREFDDSVNVDRYSNRSCAGICDEKTGSTPTYKNNLVQERLQLLYRGEKQISVRVVLR